MRRVSNALLVGCFLAAIWTPLALNLAGIDGADAEAENRKLAEWPVLDGSLDAIGRFGNRFGHWFEDHFGLRGRLIRWYGITRYFWMGVSPSPVVLLGREDWLFYTDDGGLADYTNEHPLSEEALIAWRRFVAGASAWCRARGITYLFAVAPDKYVIYPEYFPETVRQLSRLSRADQFLTATADLGVVVDLRPRLRQHRHEERLFHRTDTHWNQRGAFLGYQQIMESLHARNPKVSPPKSRDEFDASVRQAAGMDLAAIIGLKRLLTEEDLRLTPKTPRAYVVRTPEGGYATGGDPVIITEIPGSPLPRAVVFRDSFSAYMAPMISEHFSRVVYLWKDEFDPKVIEDEQPDVVLHEMVGRHLHTVAPPPRP